METAIQQPWRPTNKNWVQYYVNNYMKIPCVPGKGHKSQGICQLRNSKWEGNLNLEGVMED